MTEFVIAVAQLDDSDKSDSEKLSRMDLAIAARFQSSFAVCNDSIVTSDLAVFAGIDLHNSHQHCRNHR